MRNPALKRLSTQLLDISIDAMEHTWNIYALRTVRFALTTTYTMVGLADSRDSAVVAYEICPTSATIIFVLHVVGNVSFVKTLVVVMEYCRDVDAVWTWHAIVTFIARNAVQARNMVGDVFQESHVVIVERDQWTVRAKVVLQMFHQCHAA